MPREIPSSLAVAINGLVASGALIALVEIPRKPTGFYRLARSSRHVEAGGKVWQAAQVSFTVPDEDAEGSLGELSVTIGDVSRSIVGLVEVDDQLRGQLLTLWLHHTGESELLTGFAYQQRITAVRAGEKGVELVCGHDGESMSVPGPVYDRTAYPQLLGGAF